jgi:hypothetical protein
MGKCGSIYMTATVAAALAFNNAIPLPDLNLIGVDWAAKGGAAWATAA